MVAFHRALGFAVALTFSVVALVAACPGARADDYGLGGQLPDNLDHSFCFAFPLDAWPAQIVAWHLFVGFEHVMTATDYRGMWHPTCEAETDVVFSVDVTMAAAGTTSCRTFSEDGSHCQSSAVTINPAATTGPHDLIALGCHEVGHTLGLTDGPAGDPRGWWSDCMATDYTPSETLNAHHVAHVNTRAPHDDPAQP